MSWQTPPDDIMEMILQRIEISDRIRIGAVCKSWGSIADREEIRRAPQFPWLVCPDGDCGEHLKFSSRLEEKCYQLKLPSPVQGSWFCASSKGWLVMVKEEGLNSRMYLLNPISRALHELPLLKTVPSFEEFVETENWKQVGALFFCFKVVLSSSDVGSGGCVVAALFRDSYSRKMLGLCRPGDATWSVFPVLDDDEDHHFADILFSSGMLYALVAKRIRNCEDGNVVAGGRFELGDDCAVELKLVYDKSEKPGGFNPEDTLLSKGLCYSHLLQSTTDDQVLVVHQMQDLYDGGGGGGGNGNEADYDYDYDGGGHNVEGNEAYDDGDDHGGGHNVEGNDDQDAGEVSPVECIYKFDEEPLLETEVWTTEFRVYKLDQKNGNFLRVNRLEDKLLFLANNGCLSVPQKDFSRFQGNCILFATNNKAYGVWSASPDNGTFYLDNGEIEPKSRKQHFWSDNNNDKVSVLSDEESGNEINPSATVNMCIRSRFSWFIPSLW